MCPLGASGGDQDRAEEFARWHGISRVYDSYEEIIADDETNAFYNPLPISMHKEWTIKALRAGKHVLCEKSFASNALEAKEMEAAGAARKPLRVAASTPSQL